MNDLIQMLKRHEGVKSHVYKDHLGLETIGVGRCIAEGSLGLSDDEVEYLLANDIARCREELTDSYFWFPALNDARQAACINLIFNLGATRLRGFVKSLDAMANEKFDLAADEFMNSKWATQVGNRAIEVTDMIRSGQWKQ
jgi:lysozyme